MNYFPLYKRGFLDLFSREVFFAFFTPFLIIVALFWMETIAYSNYILPYFSSLVTFTENEIALSILNTLITIVFLALLLIVNLFIGMNLIGLFFMEKIVEKINEKHYKKDVIHDNRLRDLFKITTANFFKYFKLLLIIIPFSFVPVIGAFLPLIPAFLFFRMTLLVDTGSNIKSLEEIDLKDKKFALFIFPVFLLTLIPVFGTFGYVLGFILTAHYILSSD